MASLFIMLEGHYCGYYIHHFSRFFACSGALVRLRNDGGPKFMSREFADVLTRWGIRHIVTSPHSVKAINHLIMKVTQSGNIDCEAFDR